MRTRWKDVLPHLKRNSSKPVRKNLPKSTYSIQVRCLFVCICGKFNNRKRAWRTQTFRITTVVVQAYHQVIRGQVCLENCSGLVTDVELNPGIWVEGEWVAGDFISSNFQSIPLNFMEMLLKLKGTSLSAYPCWQSPGHVSGVLSFLAGVSWASAGIALMAVYGSLIILRGPTSF